MFDGFDCPVAFTAAAGDGFEGATFDTKVFGGGEKNYFSLMILDVFSHKTTTLSTPRFTLKSFRAILQEQNNFKVISLATQTQISRFCQWNEILMALISIFQ